MCVCDHATDVCKIGIMRRPDVGKATQAAHCIGAGLGLQCRPVGVDSHRARFVRGCAAGNAAVHVRRICTGDKKTDSADHEKYIIILFQKNSFELYPLIKTFYLPCCSCM